MPRQALGIAVGLSTAVRQARSCASPASAFRRTLTSEDLNELDEASRPDWDYPWDVIRDAESNEAKLLT